MYQILETQDYKDWFDTLSLKEKARVHSRVVKISAFGHFGKAKKLEAKLAELKWKNGRRIYFTLIKNENTIVLLLGGNKNSQSKDIKKAKSLIRNLQEQG